MEGFCNGVNIGIAEIGEKGNFGSISVEDDFLIHALPKTG
jgi:hypothetical protein